MWKTGNRSILATVYLSGAAIGRIDGAAACHSLESEMGLVRAKENTTADRVLASVLSPKLAGCSKYLIYTNSTS